MLEHDRNQAALIKATEEINRLRKELAAAQVGGPEYEYIDGQPVAMVTGPAAQVGEQDDPLIGFTQFDLDKERRRIEAATIERCARVPEGLAEEIAAHSYQDVGTRLVIEILCSAAAKIRKLKDKRV